MSKSTSNEKKLEVIHYSVVVPVYNEEDSLKPLFAELLSVMVPLNVRYEIVFVDDCSSDNSPAIMNEFQQSLPEVVKIIRLPKRSGQTFALRKGLDESIGEVAITLDADLQNDPADIPKLLKIIDEGFDCACGWRKSRQDTPLKAGLSKFGNVLQRLFTGMTIHDVSCTLRAYKRHCVGKIALNWEGQHRFIPLSLSLQGYKVNEIVSNHRKRQFGTTKYNTRRIFRVIIHFFMILKTKGTK